MALTKVSRPAYLSVRWLEDGSVGPAALTNETVILEDGVVIARAMEDPIEVTVDGRRGLSMQQIVEIIMATQEPA